MSGLVFDTLADARRLEVAGNDLRAEIDRTRTELKADIEAVRLATSASIREAELRLEGKVEAFKNDILKWMIGTLAIQTVVIVGSVTAILRWFIH